MDDHGQMFRCRFCDAPLTVDDFFELSMRLPERGESVEEFYDAELLDSVEHAGCARQSRAG
jgi:hypothetical protein